MKKFWEMKQLQNPKEAEISIFGEIVSYQWDESETTAASFQKDLKALGDVDKITLHINSPGGSVFEGIAIGNMLKSNKAEVTAYIDALAASIASVIAVSADRVVMPANSMMMIHNPWQMAVGNAKTLRKVADDLDTIAQSSIVSYLAKAGDKLTEERITEIMDNETWLTASDALEIGLADEIAEENSMAASISESMQQQFKNIPETLLQKVEEKEKPNFASEEMRQKIIERAKVTQKKLDATLGGL